MATKPEPALLGLPAELRNNIYDILIDSYNLKTWKRSRHDTIGPPVTRASRQIRNETLPMFFSKSIFYLGAIFPSVRLVYRDSPYGNMSGSRNSMLEALYSEHFSMIHEISFEVTFDEWDQPWEGHHFHVCVNLSDKTVRDRLSGCIYPHVGDDQTLCKRAFRVLRQELEHILQHNVILNGNGVTYVGLMRMFEARLTTWWLEVMALSEDN